MSDPRPGVRARLSAATIRRATGAAIAVAIVAIAFTASYAGALHDPSAHEVPVAVARQVPAKVAAQLDASPAFAADRVADTAAALRAIDRRKAYGAVTASSSGLVVTTAPAASTGIATALASTLAPQLRAGGAKVTVREAHRLPAADSRGLVTFYVVAGWVIAGYLGATLFGLAFGDLEDRTEAVLRLAALVPLGIVAGLASTLIARGIGDLPGPVIGLAAIGALTVVAVGAVTVALQSLFGLAGTGLAILLFVVLGNPSSGGPAAPELLPTPWREIGQGIPVGAGVTAFRDAAYFPAAPLTGALLVLLAWPVAGAAVAVAMGGRARSTGEIGAEVAAAATLGA